MFSVESHEGSSGSTIADSVGDADEEEEAMIASLYSDPAASGDKTARRASSTFLLTGLPQEFGCISTDTEDSSSGRVAAPKRVRFGCRSPRTVMVKNDSSGELSRRTTNVLRRYRSSSVITVVHVYDDVAVYDPAAAEEEEEGEGFNESMFLDEEEEEESSDGAEEEEETPTPPRVFRRAQSAPANVLIHSDVVVAALLSPIRRSTPCDSSSPCRTITCGIDRHVLPGRRHSVGEVIRRSIEEGGKRNPFLMAAMEENRPTYWRRRHVSCAIHS